MLLLSSLSPQLSTCFAQPTAFTYQGRLNEGATPATGLYDLRFSLHDDPLGGNHMGFPVTNSAVLVSNGLFTTTLDFGQGPFNGTPLWLQIAARTNHGGTFDTLTPVNRSPRRPTRSMHPVLALGCDEFHFKAKHQRPRCRELEQHRRHTSG